MTNRPHQSVDSPTVSSGGAAASGGLDFQAQFGVFFGLSILSQSPVYHAFGLGSVLPIWMRFETEAPVDDILVATSAQGFIAIQAKTSANLSAKPTGGLAKTIQQFVRHWLVCRDGQGTQGWDRPLDPQLDRLVLAVGPNAPATIRTDLPKALHLFIQPGMPALTQVQGRALDIFIQCARAAWLETTSDPWSPEIVPELARLIRVWTFDPYAADYRTMEMTAQRIAEPDQSRALINALHHLSVRWMSERGGADMSTLRQALMQEHIRLAAPPRYANDIRTLQQHSTEIAATLECNECIVQGAGKIQIERECQSAVLAAAEEGSLLIIGEPGAGKSAVINALARELRQKGDVIELSVDRYNVNNFNDLRCELGLENPVVQVFEAWDEPNDGWLLIDALDATRGSPGEGTFRRLIQGVLALKSRWKIVASIRTFDLRMGTQLRELFPGQPPSETYSDHSFSAVRHILVPHWSSTEFTQVLSEVPTLGRALEGAPAKLKQLAEVPFNTQLIVEILNSGIAAESLCDLANQAELLRRYWDHRIAALGAAAEACLDLVVRIMAEESALRMPTPFVASPCREALDALCAQAVLIKVENGRYIQFRHHLLFDYVASLFLLNMDRIVSGESRFPKSDALGLMMAPALGFLLQELWASETNHSRYWSAVEWILADTEGDPILRNVASRLGIELPETIADISVLAQHVRSNNPRAVAALGHIIIALAVRLEDDKTVEIALWNALAGELAGNVQQITFPLRLLVHLLLNTANPSQVSGEVGMAARALLNNAFNHNEFGVQAPSLIPFVAATFATNPTASRDLLDVVFDPLRFQMHGWEDVPALCREIGKLASAEPEFAAQVYVKTYTGSVDSDKVTRLMDSRILSFTSNARQDYGMALYSLSEFFPEFLRSHPVEAVFALVGAVEAYIARNHPPRAGDERELITRTIGGQMVRLKPDMSYIWANDLDAPYAQDGEALVAKFMATLVTLSEGAALLVARQMVSTAASAILWSRLFCAASRRDDGLVDFLWPIAAGEAWIVEPDTRKDAIDVVAAGYARRTYAEKQFLEQSAFTFDLSRFPDPPTVRKALLYRFFSAIGVDQLVTEEARSYLAALPEAVIEQRNDRLFHTTTSFDRVDALDWIPDLERSHPSNAAMITSIKETQTYFSLEAGQSTKSEIETWQGLSALDAVAQALSAPELNPDLLRFGEGVIGQGCARLAAGQYLAMGTENRDPTQKFVALLRIAVHSESPLVDDDTEARFEQSQGWSFPAARVDAAVAALEVCLQRPDLYPILTSDIDRLLDDAHPATRLQAAIHLVRVWDIDREGFWNCLALRLTHETNFSVLGGLVDVLRSVLHADPIQTESCLAAVLNRFIGTTNEERLTELTSDLYTILAVTYSSPTADAILCEWIAEPIVHQRSLHKILVSLREAIVLGLGPENNHTEYAAVRHRAQHLFHQIVLAANAPLESYDSRVMNSDGELDALSTCMKLLDTAGMQLYFATGRAGGSIGKLGDNGYVTFLQECAPTIERIGDQGSPHTIYHLVQLIEILAPYGAAKAFDLMAHIIRAGGKQGGYQYESLGADLVVRQIGIFLADNREIFADKERRQALVDCLEIFMEPGWPAARRLLYRLPEVIQ